MGKLVTFPNARLSFPELFTAKAYQDNAPRFSAQFIFPKGSKAHELIKAAIEDVAKEKWPKDWQKRLPVLIDKDNVCLIEKPKTNNQGDVLDGYEGMCFVRAGSKSRPLVQDSDGSALTEADGRIYGGCYVHAQIDIWAQDDSNRVGINAELKAVRFFKDGDAFGGGTVANPDAFDDLSVEDEEDEEEMSLA